MNFIETIGSTIQKHDISSIKKQHLLLAYLSIHLLNPGLHPDGYLSEDSGYQGWYVLLMEKVHTENVFGVPDQFTYPCWLSKLDAVLEDLEEEMEGPDPSVDELDILSNIHFLQTWLENMEPTELVGAIQTLQELYLFLTDKRDSKEEEAEKPAGTLKEASDVLNWILTK